MRAGRVVHEQGDEPVEPACPVHDHSPTPDGKMVAVAHGERGHRHD
jgi:hypothetical protein